MGKDRETAFEDLIEKAGGCAVIDGGFATQLERHGAIFNDPLWSALCLIKDPDLIKRVGTLLFISLFSLSAISCSFRDMEAFGFETLTLFLLVVELSLGPLGIFGGWC